MRNVTLHKSYFIILAISKRIYIYPALFDFLLLLFNRLLQTYIIDTYTYHIHDVLLYY